MEMPSLLVSHRRHSSRSSSTLEQEVTDCDLKQRKEEQNSTAFSCGRGDQRMAICTATDTNQLNSNSGSY